MRDTYNTVAERLWEKLEYHRNNIDISCVNFKEGFPIDQLARGNKMVWSLIKEVDQEFNDGMSEFQASWAVNQFIKGGLPMMEEYNKVNKTDLKPRP